jgi:hypothetical protein
MPLMNAEIASTNEAQGDAQQRLDFGTASHFTIILQNYKNLRGESIKGIDFAEKAHVPAIRA